MEQVFIIIAVLVFWIFKGVAGAQRRVPGQHPYDSGPLSPDAPRDVVGATRQQSLEAQQRAIEALQRWEENQRLAGGYGGPPQASAEVVPAASRTRVGRPAAIRSRTTAARQRKEAFADIAGMLDPGQPPGRTATKRSGFQVSLPAPSPGEEAARTARPVADRRPSDAALRRDAAREEEAAHKEADAQESAAAQRAAATGRADKPGTSSIMARIESLPFAARAIVYSEILGHPRSLS